MTLIIAPAHSSDIHPGTGTLISASAKAGQSTPLAVHSARVLWVERSDSGDRISLGPELQSATTTGNPVCIASSPVFGNPSKTEGIAKTLLLRIYWYGFGLKPRR